MRKNGQKLKNPQIGFQSRVCKLERLTVTIQTCFLVALESSGVEWQRREKGDNQRSGQGRKWKESSDFPSSSCHHTRCLLETHYFCENTGVIKHHFGWLLLSLTFDSLPKRSIMSSGGFWEQTCEIARLSGCLWFLLHMTSTVTCAPSCAMTKTRGKTFDKYTLLIILLNWHHISKKTVIIMSFINTAINLLLFINKLHCSIFNGWWICKCIFF